MPTATPFTALGRGNGFPFCCLTIDIINNPPDPSNDPYRLYDLCPETFTLGEVMNWYWNVSDYTSTGWSYGTFRISNNELLNHYTYYLNLDEARAAFPQLNIDEDHVGVEYQPNFGVIRDTEPYKRVCSDGRIRLRFVTRFALGWYLYPVIVYDESNNNYRFIIKGSSAVVGTRKVVEDSWSGRVGDTTTLSIPITTSKNISIPMATRPPATGGSTELRFIGTTTGSLVSYTY